MHHSSHFDAFFPVKINKKWNFCLKFWFFSNCLSCRYLKPVPLDLIHAMHFSQSKSTKCEIFAWNFDFSGTTYHRYLNPVPLDLAHLKPSLNMCHSSHFDAFFPVKINKMWNFWPEILIFQELLIVETWNKCHWIWHTSNPKYVPLKPLWCIFPSQNQQNVKFLPEILIFQELTYNRYLKPVPLDLAHLKP